MNPPSHFTRSAGPVMPAITEDAPEHQNFRRPGRLAPKWLEDLLNSQLNDEPEITWPLASGCGQTRQRHELLSIGHQSITSDSDPALNHTKDILSCICRHCRYHFVIEVETPGTVHCGQPMNYQDLFHHFVWTPATKPINAEHPKYYPLIGHVEYQCSAPTCSTSVSVEVSKPRLQAKHTAFLQDNQSIEQRKAEAIASDPERYGGPDIPPDACHLLWRYLKGVVAGEVTPDKKIDKRNKLFAIQFGSGEAASNLMTYLGYEEVNDGQSWRMTPLPEIIRPTPLGTQLAFLQNVKSELEALMDGHPEFKPIPMLGSLKKALHIEKEAFTRAVGTAYNDSDYEALGINQSTHESLFWYAFNCQRQTDPDNTDRYLEAVRRLAVGRGDEDLEIKITTFESTRIMPQANDEDEDLKRAIALSHADKKPPLSNEEKLTAAYQHFGFVLDLPPPFDDLSAAFHSKLFNSSFDRVGHIKQLALIGYLVKDAKIINCAKKELTVDDAFKYLQLQPDVDPEIIETQAFSMEADINEGKLDSGEMPILLAAISRISQSNSKYGSLMQSGSIINARHGSNYNTHTTTSPMAEEPVDFNLPVGLQNIRNTCYLNSILQYLFTVNPIRDIVLNHDQFRLENTPEALASRRIVSRSLGPGDPYAGQEFVRELEAFFKELMDANTRTIKPKQRLALAAFKSAEMLEHDGAEMLANNNDDTKPPPLPARPTETVTGAQKGTDGPSITIKAVAADDNADVSSMVSSQTLGNDASEQGYVSISRANTTSDVSMDGMSVDQPLERRISTDSALDLTDFADVGDLPAKPTSKSDDIVMTDCPPLVSSTEDAVAAPEPTLKEKICRALADDRVTGTAQEDVSEVIGTVINHLHAAIKSTGTDDIGQEDILTDTLYWTGVVTKKQRLDGKHGKPSRTLFKERTMTAYPDETKTISLVDALYQTFAREIIPGASNNDCLELYRSIVKLPPILHIQIQRTKADAGKINTAIDIPEVLYLDRFMDSDTKSDLFKKRNRSWNIAEKLQSSTPAAKTAEPTADDITAEEMADYRRTTIEDYVRDDPEDDFSILSPSIMKSLDEHGIELPTVDVTMKDEAALNSARDALRPCWLADFEAKQAAKAEKLQADLIAEQATLFDTMQEQKYLLHAIICHQGTTGRNGHYWIYIRDFERQVWRKYNDQSVEVWESGKLMDIIKSNGEPYYLAYVRADSTDIVSIPARRAPDVEVVDAPSTSQDVPELIVSDVDDLPPPYMESDGAN